MDTAAANVAQFEAWDGPQGEFWRQRADRFDAGVARYQPHLLDAAAVDDDSVVLDVGCGSGQVARELARRAPDGSVLGVDLSSPLLSLARERADREGLGNVRLVHADAQVHPFPVARHDVVVSRHGTRSFADGLSPTPRRRSRTSPARCAPAGASPC